MHPRYGIFQALCRLLVEHAHKPFEGNFVLLGRQTTGVTYEEALQIIKEVGLIPRESVDIVYDTETKASDSEIKFITEKTFISLLCSASVITIDVTDYENCDIVHDFTKPLPEELRNCADIFWLGSCLDNISNPSVALNNAYQIVKQGGRIIDFECSRMMLTAYIAYSPCFFLDWLALNDFKNVRLYLLTLKRSEIFRGRWEIFSIHSIGDAAFKYDFYSLPSDIVVLSYWVADKMGTHSVALNPIQEKYRPDEHKKSYLRNFKQWCYDNDRPVITPLSRKNPRNLNMPGYYFLGQI